MEINLIIAEDMQWDKYCEPGSHILPTALRKFSIADLLPQYDKVLYMDSDILVLQDLTAFYELDLQNNYVGVVRDMPGELKLSCTTFLHLNKYFNSGVMLLNTKRMRQEHISNVMYHKKAEHPEYLLWIRMY